METVPHQHPADEGAHDGAGEGSDRAPKERDLFGREPKGRTDWAHRRGEPRTFALLWTLYLMLSTLVMFASLSASPSVTPEVYRPAARVLLVSVMIGITLLWPMTRLSQLGPSKRPIASVLKDLVVVLLPVQALVWPHALGMLSGWPLSVVAALALSMGAWALVTGGVLGIALATMRPESGAGVRGAWMAVFVVLSVGAPVWFLVAGGYDIVEGGAASLAPAPGRMLSPLTSIVEITRDRAWTGRSARVGAGHWRPVLATLALGGVLMVGAKGLALARSGRPA